MTRFNLRRFLYNFGFTVGSLIFLYQIFLTVRNFKFLHFSRLGFLFLALAFIMATCSIFFQAIIWQNILNGFGYKVKFQALAKGFFISFLPRYIPGTIWGYISRSHWLFVEFSIPYGISSFASLIEMISVLLAAILIISNPITSNVSGLWLIYNLIICILCFILINRLTKTNFPFSKAIKGFLGIPKFPIRHWGITYVAYILHWLIIGVASYFCVLAVQPSLHTSLPYLKITTSYTFAWVFGFVIFFIPGGLGIREVSLAYLLSTYVGFSFIEGSSIALIIRLEFLLAELFCLIFFLFVYKKGLANPNVLL